MKVILSKLLLSFLLMASVLACSKGSEPTPTPDPEPEPEPVGDIGPHIQPEGETLAFPGAEGFGKATTGGRGGKVYIVSNLNDTGPGSLREAVNASGKRIIVFAVSGTIDLRSRLLIRNGDITIAGQSAPGDGICISGHPVQVSADNVIIRYLRFRLGNIHQVEGDALEGRNQKNIIIDHCSISWATDECASFYDNENFTMQWCIISESLNESLHEKGAHGYGGIWGGMGASFHHNLLAHHNSRMPRFNGSRYHQQPEKEVVDYRYNVVYNWMNNNSYGGEQGFHNMVNNYYKAGPATPSSKRSRIVNPSSPYGKFFVNGNFVVGNAGVSEDNWNGGVQGVANLEDVKSLEPFTSAAIPEQSAAEAYEAVLNGAGASLRRDAVDVRIVDEVRNGTVTYYGSKGGKAGIIDSQEDVGGWPILNALEPPADADRDGMPDSWETAQGLDPNNADDAAYYKKGTPYTYLEIYLHSLLE